MANTSITKRECSEFICERVATVYAGGPYSGDWADYYCNDHIPSGYRVWDKLAPVCPSCDGFIPNNETPGAYMGAISRKDNTTEICSACGTAEALADFFSNT
jgi:hypothetical protein